MNIFSLVKKAFSFTKSAVKEIITNKRPDEPEQAEPQAQEPQEPNCMQQKEKANVLQKLKKNRGSKNKSFEPNR